MKIMDKMMWMGVGLGAGLLYKTYEKDICALMKKQKNKMMQVPSTITNKKTSSK